LYWATDLLTQEVLTWHGVVTYYILVFINLKTRHVVLGGITAHPTGEWMAQVARNLTGFDGELVVANARYLIRDRRELFDGLALAGNHYDWQTYPVIHLDLGTSAARSAAELEKYWRTELMRVRMNTGWKTAGITSPGDFSN